MTDTTITNAPSTTSTTVPTPPKGTPTRRRRLAVLAACLAFAAIAGAAVVSQLDSSGGRSDANVVPAEPTAPARTGLPMSPDASARWAEAGALPGEPVSAPASADAMERQAQDEQSRQAEACRATAVAPDAQERCAR